MASTVSGQSGQRRGMPVFGTRIVHPAGFQIDCFDRQVAAIGIAEPGVHAQQNHGPEWSAGGGIEKPADFFGIEKLRALLGPE
jgi:hypothetical protein